jgi:DNA-3-methyladenine glycosylase
LSFSGATLHPSFYERPAEELARALLGKLIVHGSAVGRIVETEAYLGLQDRAAHAWRGITPRTKVLFGPAGHAYVYLIYGMYECLNIVADKEGEPGCVLIRALEPVAGLAAMRKRRGNVRDHELANGPGKLTIAMGITRAHNDADLTRGALTVHEETACTGFETGVSTRIGIRHNADWPMRFYIAGNRSVSKGQSSARTGR